MYGVIDIGSNTMRLNIYKYEKEELYLMLSKKIMASLSGYVNDAGYLTSKGIDKAVESLNEFKITLSNITLNDTFIFATASLRNIKNSVEATRLIEEKTGLDINVISGEEEATLDFLGASLKNNLDGGLLVDIGGGSTEIVFYNNKEIYNAISLPIGSLSLHNKYVKEFLPTINEIKKIKKMALNELKVLKDITLPQNTKYICGVGGTVRASCKLINNIYDLPAYNSTIMVDDMQNIINYYLEERHSFLANLIKTIPDRLHTILPGMIVLDTIANYYNSQIINVSEYGVREGYLIKMIEDRG